MIKQKLTLKQWLEDFDIGAFDSKSVDVQMDAGWYDWFCHDSCLANKTKKLAKYIKKISRSERIDQENTCVLFKNNNPCSGKLYDDFRICDLETGDVIYTIIPKCGHKVNFGVSEVWGKTNDFNGPIVSGTWKDVCSFFGV